MKRTGKASVKYRNRRLEVDAPVRVKDILRILDLLPEYVVVSINGQMVTEKDIVQPGDEVIVVSAISGGAE